MNEILGKANLTLGDLAQIIIGSISGNYLMFFLDPKWYENLLSSLLIAVVLTTALYFLNQFLKRYFPPKNDK